MYTKHLIYSALEKFDLKNLLDFFVFLLDKDDLYLALTPN